jgi:uncharacterized membrane protein YcaP (DUF421 family)
MDIVLRAGLAFIFVFFLTRVLGKRELNSLEPFDVIMLVMLGDLVQQGVTQNDFSVTGSAIVIVMMTLLSMLTAFVAYRSPRFSTVIDGEPVILVEHGRPLHGNLRRERITLRELAAQARMNNIADLADVHYAVLETSGAISFLTETSSG